jgi:hypothetical protein
VPVELLAVHQPQIVALLAHNQLLVAIQLLELG